MRLSSQDVRLAVRSFARQRGFTIVAVLSLALAISLNTTMYSVIDAMVRPKLAMQDPDRLYAIRLWGDVRRRVDAATIDAIIRSGFKTYEAATYSAGDFNERAVEFGDQYAFASSGLVALDYFRVLGVAPVRGRVFGDADLYAAPQPVLISDRLAEKLSPRTPLPIGSVIQIDGESHPVIGVLGKGMDFSAPGGRIWRLPKPGPELAARVPSLIRIRENATIEEVAAEFTLFSNRIAELAGESPRDVRFDLKQINKPQFQLLNFHYALIAAVVAVLLVACANIANLQLARGIARGRELALRTALGASRRQLVAQLLLESALLAVAGLTLGLVLTFWGSHVLASRIPPSVADYVIAPQITWRVFAFAIIAGVLCTILIGLVPAIRVSRVDPNQMLKSGAGTGSNRKNRRQYAAMVVAEIGLSLALLCGAALVVRTSLRFASISIGYDVKPLSTAWLYLQPARDTMIPIYAFFALSSERIRAVPGVGEIGVSVMKRYGKYTITVDERGGVPREVLAPGAVYSAVSPQYLRTFRRPIVKGRDFLDGIPSEPEVIVDQQTAGALWPGVDPVGMQIKMGDYKSDVPWVRVVGVVRDRHDRSVKTYSVPTSMRRDIGEIFYLPAGSETVTVSKGTSVSFVVRATSDPERIPIALRRELSKTPGAVYASAASMEETLGIVRQRMRHDFIASMFSLFAAMAIGLAALGIHGIVAHSVAERTRELGVRIALGASSRNILHVVLREGNAVALAGVAVGLYLTKRTAGWLQAFTFENDRYDAPLFAAMGVLLFAVAVLSALLPALRATRVDPVESLRSE